MSSEAHRHGAAPALTPDGAASATVPSSSSPAEASGRRPHAKERILEAARDEFARYGYTGASLRAIAAAANIDVALIAYYYGNKASLYSTVASTIDNGADTLADLFVHRRADFGRLAAELLARLERDERAVKGGQSVFRTLFTPNGSDDPVHAGLVADSARVLGYGRANSETELVDELCSALIIGVFVVRHVFGIEPTASASIERMAATIGPLLQRIIDRSAARSPREGVVASPAASPDVVADPEPVDDAGGGDTRSRILGAARRSFATLGYHGTALRALADEVGCNVALIPYHFGNKADLFREVVGEGLAGLNLLHVIAEQQDAHPAEAAEALVRTMVRLFNHEPASSAVRAVLLTSAAPRPGDEDLAGELHAALQRLSDRVMARRDIGSLRADDLGLGDGEFPAPELALALHMFGSTFVGLYVAQTILRMEPLASASEDEIVDVLAPVLEGLLRGDWDLTP